MKPTVCSNARHITGPNIDTQFHSKPCFPGLDFMWKGQATYYADLQRMQGSL